MLDADIYLPGEFRDIINTVSLERSSLYGLSGRRVVESYEQFSVLRELTHWATNILRTKTIIGFFNLFHFNHSRVRSSVRSVFC